MGVWGEQILPRATEVALRGHAVGELRQRACRTLSGRVLQPGFGSGLDLRFLPAAVTAVGAIEPADVAWALSERRRRQASVPVSRIGLDGQRIAAETDSYDSALITFSLCTIPDAAAALAEVRRCVRPGGVVAIVEHGLSPDPAVARWQHRLDPLEQRLAGGCHLTRDPVRMLDEADLVEVEFEQNYLPGPRLSHPWAWVTVATGRVPTRS